MRMRMRMRPSPRYAIATELNKANRIHTVVVHRRDNAMKCMQSY